MKTYLQNYDIVRCESLPEALANLRKTPAPVPIAGGTDLMVNLNYGKLPAGAYLDLQSIPELRSAIDIDDDSVRLSALTTYMDVRMHPFFKDNMRLLAQAAAVVGAPGIQVRGTWAGNIVNASPAADGVPALMAYDARLTLTSATGERVVALAEFYHDYKRMDRRCDELITAITMPIPRRHGFEYYRKVGERKAQAISKVLLAARVEKDGDRKITDARIVYGSVMPCTYRAVAIENMLHGQRLTSALISAAVERVGTELRPIDDMRSNARYRLKVAQNLLEECLNATLLEETNF